MIATILSFIAGSAGYLMIGNNVSDEVRLGIGTCSSICVLWNRLYHRSVIEGGWKRDCTMSGKDLHDEPDSFECVT